MKDPNPYHRLKAAAARQQQLNLSLAPAGAAPEQAHPVTTLVRALPPAAPPATALRVLTGASPVEAAPDSEPVAARVDHVPAATFVVERMPDTYTPPWWVAKQGQFGRASFYPPVPITIAMDTTSDAPARPPPDFATATRARRAWRPSDLRRRLAAACMRPRALFALIGAVAIILVGAHAVADYRAAEASRAQQAARSEAIRRSLALLEAAAATAAPAPSTAAASGTSSEAGTTAAGARTPDAPTTAGEARDLSPDSMDAYVQKALPQLSGEQPAPGGQGAVPKEIRDHPLPDVPASPGVAVRSVHKKAPIGDRIEGSESTPHAASPSRLPTRKVAVIGSHSSSAIPAKEGGDPLAHVTIRASVVSLVFPFRVHQIAEQLSGRSAYVLPVGTRDLGEGVWVEAGHLFPNRWELLEVDRAHVIFLSPDGQVAKISPVPVE